MANKEIGRIGQRRYGGTIYEEFLHELRGTRGIEVYREMSENDDVVGAILFAIEMLVRQCDWNVEPGGDTAKDKEAAEFVESCMHDMQDTWTDTISEILSFLTYGWSFHEIVYKRRIGILVPDDGLEDYIRQVGHLPERTTDDRTVDQRRKQQAEQNQPPEPETAAGSDGNDEGEEIPDNVAEAAKRRLGRSGANGNMVMGICIKAGIPMEMHTSYTESEFPYHFCKRVVYHLQSVEDLENVVRRGAEIVRVVFVATEKLSREEINRISDFVRCSDQIDELSFRQMVNDRYETEYYNDDFLKAGHNKGLWHYIRQKDYNIYYAENRIYTKFSEIEADIQEER